MKEALIIFIKNPVKGKVKTRLAHSIGQDKALDVYNKLLDHTRKVTAPIPQDKFLFYSDFINREDQWDNDNFIKKLQLTKGDLGAKMHKAFDEIFEDKYDKAVIIGSDCPELSGSILADAFRSLDKHDMVIGPATDGGYYLLGMKKMHPPLFNISRWSTPSVFDDTMDAIFELQLSFFVLPELLDIDYLEDLNKFDNKSKGN